MYLALASEQVHGLAAPIDVLVRELRIPVAAKVGIEHDEHGSILSI